MPTINFLLAHWADLFFLCGFLLFFSPLLGKYLYLVFTGQKTFLHPILSPLEQGTYRLLKVSPHEEMSCLTYACHLGLFHLVCFVSLFVMLLLQNWIFSAPFPLSQISIPLALNITASYITNTNWQSYVAETTLTNGVQMMGLMVQQFLSPAVGVAATLVFLRGITSKGKGLIGNVWVDLVRALLYIFLPLSILLAGFLLHQGSIATFQESIDYTTLEGEKQKVILGPIAAQTAIMQLGTNGGGFFQANSAHPFANPTDSSNVLLIVAILLIPAAIPHLYGEMMGNRKEGWILFLLMLLFWFCGSVLAESAQAQPNPFYEGLTVIEGQEIRNGTFASVLWGASTTATSNGSVNASLDSFAPLSGGVMLSHLLLGETLFGGVGVGLATVLFFVLLTLFLSGLMVGRSAEYQGKKIHQNHMQWVMCALLLPSALILLSSSLCILYPAWFQGASVEPLPVGPHGFTSLLYAVSSCVMNNGSAFNSFPGNTTGCNLFFALLMLLGRGAILLPSLALGGLFSKQMPIPSTAGSFSTTTPLFFLLLGTIILLYAVLSFFPCWILGPFSEQVLLNHGKLW